MNTYSAQLLDNSDAHCGKEMTSTSWTTPSKAVDELRQVLYPPQIAEMLRMKW